MTWTAEHPMARLAGMLALQVSIEQNNLENLPCSYAEGASVLDMDAVRTGQSENVVSNCLFDKNCRVRVSGGSRLYGCRVYDGADVVVEDGAVLNRVKFRGKVHVSGTVAEDSSFWEGSIGQSQCNNAEISEFSVGAGCAVIHACAEKVVMADDSVLSGIRMHYARADIGAGCLLVGWTENTWWKRPRVESITARNSYADLACGTLIMGNGARIVLGRSVSLQASGITVGPSAVLTCMGGSARLGTLSMGSGGMLLLNETYRQSWEAATTACPIGPFGNNLAIRLGRYAFLDVALNWHEANSQYPVTIEVADNESAVIK